MGKNRHKVLLGQLHKSATHDVQWMYYFIMCTIVLLICTSFIAQMIVGAVPPSVGGTSSVLSKRQQRMDRMSITRRNITNNRLDRVRQQRLRQQQVRDQNRERSRSLRAASTPERQQQVRDQNRDQHSQSRAALSPEQSPAALIALLYLCLSRSHVHTSGTKPAICWMWCLVICLTVYPLKIFSR